MDVAGEQEPTHLINCTQPLMGSLNACYSIYKNSFGVYFVRRKVKNARVIFFFRLENSTGLTTHAFYENTVGFDVNYFVDFIY